MANNDYFTEENLIIEKQKEYLSGSGKYKLIVDTYETEKGCWNFTRGLIYRTSDNKCIGDVKRNYSSFLFCWVEQHLNGHDYLICGENYQGQTIIELDTEKRVDYLPEAANKGFGFCWASCQPSPEKNMLVVCGCIWACPYELRIYDFSNPMKMPLPELGADEHFTKLIKWVDNNSCEIGREYEYCKIFNKRERDLTDEELDRAYEAADNRKYSDVFEYRADTIIWTKPGM